MLKISIFIILTLSLFDYSSAQTHRIIESTTRSITIEFDFSNAYKVQSKVVDGIKFNTVEGKELNLRKPGQPWLPDYRLSIGIPHSCEPVLKILNVTQEKQNGIFIVPTPDSLDQPFNLVNYDQSIYNSNNFFPLKTALIDGDFVMRYARIVALSIAPFQFNPITRELTVTKKILIQIDYNDLPSIDYEISNINDQMTDEIIRSSVVNYEQAKTFAGKRISLTSSPMNADSYWYNPVKDYYKIYLNEKGVYRITYDWLVNSGVPANTGLQNMNLELFCNGESIPIDVVDVNQDQLFNSGDYFQFVGEKVKPANQYTTINVYNKTNVYWFSYQADSLNFYRDINGYKEIPFPVINSTIETIRWEEDRVFNNLGHADNDHRDYWYGGSAETRAGTTINYFEHAIQENIGLNWNSDKPQAKIKFSLHGLTTPTCVVGFAHNVKFLFNGHPIGTKSWNGQESENFEKSFYLSTFSFGGDTAWLNFNGFQNLIAYSTGNSCDTSQSDIFLINYFEFDYWRWNKINSNHYYFKSPPNDYQENIYQLWEWTSDNMKIYIPERGELISNPDITNDQYRNVYFVDTISSQTEYFCVDKDYFLEPDSISKDLASDLRNNSNGADYIIITHQEFTPAAERLAEYRSNNLPGYVNPRVKIVYVSEIYDEFSNGLANPFALQWFVKHAFENWQSPAPAYVTILGDASHDLRKILPSSRQNYVPSIPYHAQEYGLLPSDNLIVAVSGSDISPDLALGRLSCETLEQANHLIDKIIAYPSDNSKEWKQNILLLASGLSYQDQISFGFNNASKQLENLYLRPNGFNVIKVFNFPEPPDIGFYGSGPRMREEINKGAAIVNYYGHGGGAQWDLIFTKDDLYELNNNGRQPLALSITCYTAHFDNAEAFGEVFIRLPGKGAIGFWGSVGLTWWSTGQSLNRYLFNQLFNLKNHVIGKAILNAKASQGGGFFDEMVAQLSYLGDPAIELCLPKYPDFVINSSDITISPTNPLVNDSVEVKLKIKNLGTSFIGDSVTVQLYNSSTLRDNLIGEVKLGSFGEVDSAIIKWIPESANLYNLIYVVNDVDTTWEFDHSDNVASGTFAVYSFSEPNIVRPMDGYNFSTNQADFKLVDIGSLFSRNFNYKIEIDTTQLFNSPSKITSQNLSQQNQVISWVSPPLGSDQYYWRAIVFDDLDTNQSSTRMFSINKDTTGPGYFASEKHLIQFVNNNAFYFPPLKSLVLNTELKPPHPDETFLQDSIFFSLPPDSTEPVTFTTDGSYFYYSQIPFPGWDSTSRIYKVGTGLNGTIAGSIDSVPNISVPVYSSLFYREGYLYTNTGERDNILRIDPVSGDTLRIIIPDSLLWTESKQTQWGGCYFYFDGNFLYNLGVGTELHPNKFVLRKFDPASGWSKVGEDIIFNGETIPMVMSFAIWDDYMIVFENYINLYLRRYKLSNGTFEEEWPYRIPTKKYYTFTYDYQNDLVYFCRFVPIAGSYEPGFFRYSGTYKDAFGSILSPEIGPANKWDKISYDIDDIGSEGTYSATLFGKNVNSQEWDTLATNIPSQLPIDTVDAELYDHLRFRIDLVDSSFGASEPLKFKSLKVNYTSLPEIVISPDEYTFSADTLLHGFPVDMEMKVRNVGYATTDSLKIAVYLNNADTTYFTRTVSIKPDSVYTLDQSIITDKLLYASPVSELSFKVVATNKQPEFYTFNNIAENKFYISRDSIRPRLTVTFDGQEIVDNDIISARPEIVVNLKDNSPLQVTPENFTLIYKVNDSLPRQLLPSIDNLQFNYSPYPDNECTISWNPQLTDGRHRLEILAKDSSGNYSDTTSYSRTFFVYNEADLREVYNYPNPFKDDTYFTFELRGFEASSAEDVQIKVYTVAGRLIRDFSVPPSQLQPGFNRVYWDGKDQDGDLIANGLYLYKVIARLKGETKTVTQKLAKLK
ncbi:MAG: hypothetical protein IPM56_10255 [Ignavibacteriales bacterium]|nr:MAG: hypothetical protein IPM56_10255 [Ignavibacteriales bacterium]